MLALIFLFYKKIWKVKTREAFNKKNRHCQGLSKWFYSNEQNFKTVFFFAFPTTLHDFVLKSFIKMHCAKLEGGAGLKGLIKEKKVVYFKKNISKFYFLFYEISKC